MDDEEDDDAEDEEGVKKPVKGSSEAVILKKLQARAAKEEAEKKVARAKANVISYNEVPESECTPFVEDLDRPAQCPGHFASYL